MVTTESFRLKNSIRWLLSILSGCLLVLAWPDSSFTWLIFVAWIPLLLLAHEPIKKIYWFLLVLLTMLIWNTGTTWWIWNSTDIGTIAAIIANSLLMCIPWLGYRNFLRQYGSRAGFSALIFFWMTFELIHLNWQISWPWLHLGNVFCMHPAWVRWYEISGIGGGTLLVLLTNICLYDVLQALLQKKSISNRKPALVALILLAAFLISYNRYASIDKNLDNPAPGNIVIIQPNIDPYQKFSVNSIAEQIERLISLTEQQIDSNTRLVVWPETALSAGDWQENTARNNYYQPVFALLAQHPNVSLLSGIELFVNYGKEKTSVSARLDGNGNYYDAMNAAMLAQQNESLQFYYKSKLVPGVETLPSFLRFLSPLFEQFGGTTGGYGSSTSPVVLQNNSSPYRAAPIICYESIYGEYTGSYVKRGANLLTIITNDGWWGNTPGHRQHLQMARLRAIETGKWIVRSANTGISAIIDTEGNVLESRPWATSGAIKYAVPVNDRITPYVKYGDWIYYLMSFMAVLALSWHSWQWLKKRLARK
jgi:apolipoprotein N-acyltransferase